MNTAVPILQPQAPKLDDGREHIVQLTTTDGAKHYLAFNFNQPMQDGVPVVGAAVNFDPHLVGLQNVVRLIVMGHAALDGRAVKANPVVEVEGGALVVLTRVVSVDYLGRLTSRRRKPVTKGLALTIEREGDLGTVEITIELPQ
jgi:hypothetical protein